MSIIKRKAGSIDVVKSVLEFDAVPTEGSKNLVESGAVAKAIGNLGQPLQWKGPATVAQLNTGITGIQPGWTYTLTDAGTLTDGSIDVEAGDEVAWTEDGEWFKVGGEGGKIAVFEVSPIQSKPYPTFGQIHTEVLAGKTVALRIVNYNGQSDSPADYYYLHSWNSAPNAHSYSFICGTKIKTVNSSNEWSDTGASRYTTRSVAATLLPASINVNDGESVLWNINRVNSGAITIAAPAGTTDAQVAIISTGSSFFINTTNLSVTVGGVSIPVFDLRLPRYSINTGYEYDILKSNYQPECSIEVPPSFDEVGLVHQVLTNADIAEYEKYTTKTVVQIVGQVALLFAK